MFGIDPGFLVGAVVVIAIGIFFLKGFDKIAGRGPKQIKNGINSSSIGKGQETRIPCPHCAEQILLAAQKCPFCHTEL